MAPRRRITGFLITAERRSEANVTSGWRALSRLSNGANQDVIESDRLHA